MEKKARVQSEVFLEKVRCAWFTLEKPDYKYAALGVYGVGAKLDEASAAALNDVVSKVGEQAGEHWKTYFAGDIAKLNMDAARRDRKTGDLISMQPQIWMPDLNPATVADIQKLDRNSKVTVKVRVSSYPQKGEADEQGNWGPGCGPGGVSIKLAGVQIVEFDAGAPSAVEQGFSAVEAF